MLVLKQVGAKSVQQMSPISLQDMYKSHGRLKVVILTVIEPQVQIDPSAA